MTDMAGTGDFMVLSPNDVVPASQSRQVAEDSLAASARSRRTETLPKSPAFFGTLVVLVVVKAWLMRGFALDDWNPLGAAFEIALALLLLGLADVAPPRRWYWLDLAVYSAVSVLFFAITVYVRFYAALFDPHMLAMAGQLGTVTDVVAELIKPVYALFVIDIPVLIAWVIMLKRLARRQKVRMAASAHPRRPRVLAQPTARNLRVAALAAAAAIVVVGQLVSASRVPTDLDGVAVAKSRGLAVAQAAVFLPRPSGDDEKDEESPSDVVAPGTQIAQVATATAAPVVLTPGGKMQKRIDRIRGAANGMRIAPFPVGAYRGKNLIVVQVEALNTMLINERFQGREITPNLNSALKDSWYFPNTYSETGIGNTADAEFIMNTSLYAPRSQAAPVVYADREIPALPRLLAEQGYDTYTMHPNRITYWNRKELYSALGFTHYFDMPYFHWVDIMGFGSSDEVLFRKAVPELKKSGEPSSPPYYAQLITLSAHTPFQYIPQSRRPIKTPSSARGTIVGEYITAQSYGDMAIGQFVSALKSAGIWDSSIVVFYGDHTGMLENNLSGTDAKLARSLLGRDYGPADRQRIPLIIHLPGQKTPEVNKDVVGMVDIMPTIADLLGLDISQVPHMGRSAFVKSNAMVPLNSYLPGGSFVNDRVLFMPGLGFDDGKAVEVGDSSSAKITKAEENDYKRMRELTKLSSKWMESLPKRKAASLSKAWIPNKEARKAAEPLGAKQRGKGSE
jgi:phosphoglycerol transferase MdoB-like AlkP superfamily enzyme